MDRAAASQNLHHAPVYPVRFGPRQLLLSAPAGVGGEPQDRFRGTCYQAANWVGVGQTTGRTRQSQRHRDNAVHAPVKDIYLYPLRGYGRRQLCR